MRRLYRMGLTTTSGGNISLKIDGETVLMTPSASDKGRMRGDEICVMGMDGRILEGPPKPTIESAMHIRIYKARPDVGAVVHAHPVHASAFAATDAEINVKLIAESYAILGELSYVKYLSMGSQDLADEVSAAAKSANCIMMRNHGVLAVGKDLLEAFNRIEVLETAARMTVICASPPLNESLKPLDGKALQKISDYMRKK
jgi:L-fuculose-phosphate aldolase